MRKLITLILAALLLLATSALAEDIDLTPMTIDELAALRSRINAEINSRMKGTDAVFPPFDYQVGKHIPAGMYLITCIEITNGETYGQVAAWAEGESNWSCHTVEYFYAPGEFAIVEVAEGDTMRLYNVTVTITPFTLPTI